MEGPVDLDEDDLAPRVRDIFYLYADWKRLEQLWFDKCAAVVQKMPPLKNDKQIIKQINHHAKLANIFLGRAEQLLRQMMHSMQNVESRELSVTIDTVRMFDRDYGKELGSLFKKAYCDITFMTTFIDLLTTVTNEALAKDFVEMASHVKLRYEDLHSEVMEKIHFVKQELFRLALLRDDAKATERAQQAVTEDVTTLSL